jgi:hypothetical protein
MIFSEKSFSNNLVFWLENQIAEQQRLGIIKIAFPEFLDRDNRKSAETSMSHINWVIIEKRQQQH